MNPEKNISKNYTFLFTDIEGSTMLAQQFRDKLPESLDRHNKIMSDAVLCNNGTVFKTVGDAFCCAFENPGDAIDTAVDMQRKLISQDWDEATIKVRIGIHTGTAEWTGSDFRGYITLARTQRIMSAACGNQILVSEDTLNMSQRIESDGVNFRDLGYRRLKDLIQPVKLFQIESPGLPSSFPPLKTLDARPNNLPVQLTSFIGKENEISEVKKLINANQLVTIIGPGGTGKTRFSLQVCAELIDDFENGVWFIELADFNDPLMIPMEVMKSLGIKEQSNINPETAVNDYLKNKTALLMFDNCEHLIDACSVFINKLLSASPKLKIITTSREMLRVRGEQIYRLQSLSCPKPGQAVSPEELMSFESVRLFTERALLVNPKFRVDEINLKYISEICHSLDGIPLAIELAAARIKILSPEKINEKLSDRFKLLKSGSRTDLPRQQTLKALIDWSYDLLNDDEKTLWKYLSVFKGGFTLEAAEDVCSGNILQLEDVLHLLENLTEKSIISYDPSENRYKMLETIKQYGINLFEAKDEFSEIMNKFFKYYFQFTETHIIKLRGAQIKEYISLFDAEQSNFETALQWSEQSGFIKEGTLLNINLGRYRTFRSNNLIGLKWCEVFINKRDLLPESLCANLYNWAGQYSSNRSEFDISEKFFRQSLEIYEKLNDLSWIASTTNSLGALSARKGDYEEACKLFEKGLIYKTELNDKSGICGLLSNLGQLELLMGNFDRAVKYSKEVLQISNEIEDRLYLFLSLRLSGQVAFHLGNFEDAEEHYGKALSLSRDIDFKNGISASLSELSEILTAQNKFEQAELLINENTEFLKELEDKFYIALAQNSRGFFFIETGKFDEAEKEYKEAADIYDRIKEKNGYAVSLSGLARVKFENKEYEKSYELFKQSLLLHYQMKNLREISNLLIHISKFSHLNHDNPEYISSDNSLKFLNLSYQLKHSMGIKLSEKELSGFSRIISDPDISSDSKLISRDSHNSTLDLDNVLDLILRHN